MDEGTLDQAPATPRRVRMTQIARWDVDGSTRAHHIEVVSSDGEQMVDALIDGKFAARADRSNESGPWAYLELGVVDGREVGVYVESRDGGATFVTDLFVDGFSELTSDPISTLDARIADAEMYPTRLQPHYRKLAIGLLLLAAVIAVAVVAFLWYLLASYPPKG